LSSRFAPDNDSIPEYLSSKRIFEEFYDKIWKDWFNALGNRDIEGTFKKTGSYAISLLEDNIRIVVINSVYCSRQNFWSLYSPVDQGGQLAFLVTELTAAEKKGQYVHIVGHIPPNRECTETWLSNYLAILDRFSHVITGSFFGHTHKDQLYLYIPSGKTSFNSSVATAFVGGSITTFGHVNPCFKVYSLDTDKVCPENADICKLFSQ
jgi:sphingomyelin phosphodiesterase